MEIIIWIACVAIAIIAVVALLSLLPTTKGWWGELIVRCIIGTLPKNDYHVIYDLRLRDGRKTSQTDHAVISRYGIFVIETKNWFGGMVGNVKDTMWQRHVLGMHYRIKSPVVQNQWHIDFLTDHFPDIRANAAHIHNVVVFNFGAILKLRGNRSNIMMAWKLRKYILGYRTPVISDDTVRRIIAAIPRSRGRRGFAPCR